MSDKKSDLLLLQYMQLKAIKITKVVGELSDKKEYEDLVFDCIKLVGMLVRLSAELEEN